MGHTQGLTYLEPFERDVARGTSELREQRGKKLTDNSKSKQGKSVHCLESWEQSSELKLIETKRICSRCKTNEVYQGFKNMDWCEQCIWEFVNAN